MTDRDEWLAWRRGGIGGSDIAAILGLSSTVTVEQLADDPEAINTDAIDVGEATVVVEP